MNILPLGGPPEDGEMVNLTPTINFTGTDRFEVIRCLGAGGMGVVYEVEDGVDLQTFILGETPLSDRKSDANAATASVTQLSVDADAGVESPEWARDLPHSPDRRSAMGRCR